MVPAGAFTRAVLWCCECQGDENYLQFCKLNIFGRDVKGATKQEISIYAFTLLYLYPLAFLLVLR